LNKFIKSLHRMRFIPLVLIVFLTVMMAVPATLMADQSTVDLGTASTFAVLAGTTITNTGPTTITGDIGLHPGTSFTGSTSVTQIDGSVYINDAVAVSSTS
jgi:hypothetical protein